MAPILLPAPRRALRSRQVPVWCLGAGLNPSNMAEGNVLRLSLIFVWNHTACSSEGRGSWITVMAYAVITIFCHCHVPLWQGRSYHTKHAEIFHWISRIVAKFFCYTWLGLYQILFPQLTEAKNQFRGALADVNFLGCFFFFSLHKHPWIRLQPFLEDGQ